MIWTRRDAIKGLGAAGAAAALGPVGTSAADGRALTPGAAHAEPAAAPSGRRAQSPLRILFIGGTGFIGPHMVRRAMEHGHTVTLFNRGRTNPHLFPEVEKYLSRGTPWATTQRRFGLSLERETEMLAAWRERRGL